MIDLEKLQSKICRDMGVLRESTLADASRHGYVSFLDMPPRLAGIGTEIIKFGTLYRHLEWAHHASHDQEKLRKVVESLATNCFVGGRHWREAFAK